MSNDSKSILFVDLDGTLIKSDVSFESFFALLKKNPLYFFLALVWMLKGKPYMKRQISDRVKIDVTHLPYNKEFLEYLNKEKEQGRRLVLASASDLPYVKQVADHLQLFEGVIATDAGANLSGENKLQVMREYAKGQECAYAGNSSVDKAIWLKTKDNIIVSDSSRFISRMRKELSFAHEFYYKDGKTAFFKALRPHQWSKNLLLFAPLVLAHKILQTTAFIQTILAFIALSACASAIYIVNDLCDLESDRRHHIKRRRPLAAGNFSVKAALLTVPLLLIFSLFITLQLPHEFAVCLDLYVITALLYSFRLKQIAIVDIIILAMLYVVRVLAGGMAAEVPVSQWLLSFSLFLFTSLACLKRFSELKTLKAKNQSSAHGRGYGVDDIDAVAQFGAASAFVSLLVLVFYINSKEVQVLYKKPEFLWLICPLVMFWVMRVWLLAYRGKVNEDPIVFALRDKASYLVGVALIGLILFAI